MLDFILVRTLFVLIFGVTAAYFRPADTPLWVGAAEGVVIAGIAIFLETRIARVSLKRLIGAAIGMLAGLVCSALVSVVLGRLGAESSPVLHFAQVMCLLLLVYIGAVTGSSKGELLNLSAFGGYSASETTSGITIKFSIPA